MSEAPEAPGLIQSLQAHSDDLDGYYAAVHAASGTDRIFWEHVLEAWVVTGFPECAALLSDARLCRARLALPRGQGVDDLVQAAEVILAAQMMFSDDPAAAASRRAWARTIAEVTTDPADVARLSLGVILPGVEFNAYAELLQPFVSRTICGRLGLDEVERLELYPFIMHYARFLDGKLEFHSREFVEALYAIVILYSRLAARSTGVSQDTASGRHRHLADYLVSLVAGHESAAYLIAVVLIHAGDPAGHLRHAGESRQRLLQLIREAARIDSPVQLVGRRAMGDVDVHGCRIRAGDRVYLHLGAANRDSRVFDEPHRFDPDRASPPNLAFGSSRSHCIGSALALEEVVAFLTVLGQERCRLEIDRGGIEWDHGLAGRGIRRLPARLARC
jgi:cytochrome P450